MSNPSTQDPSRYFYCRNGKVLKSLQDMNYSINEEIKAGNTSNFEFHAVNGNNDYANWLRDVLLLPELAQTIRNIQSPTKTLEEIQKALNETPNIQENAEPQQSRPEQEQQIQGIPQEIVSNVQRLTQSSDTMADKVFAMKAKINAKNTKLLTELEDSKDLYQQTYAEISEHRKEGKDMFIPALMLRNLKAKVAYFEASRSETDYEKVKEVAANIKKEIQDSLDYKPKDLKSEVLEGAGLKKQETTEA